MSELHVDQVQASYSDNNWQDAIIDGVYIPAYQAYPAMVHYIRQAHTLMRLCSAVGGGKVYKDSTDEDNEFSIAAISVVKAGSVVTLAGSVNNALSGGDVAHYVYIDLSSSPALTINTTGWPTTTHVRIATITLSGGAWDWDNFVDHRHAHALHPAYDVSGSLAAPTVTVATENATPDPDEIEVTIQVVDAAGNAVSGEHLLDVWLSETAKSAALATTAPTSVSIDAGAALETLDKHWRIVTDSTGQAVLTLGSNGTETWHINAAVGGKIGTGEVTFA